MYIKQKIKYLKINMDEGERSAQQVEWLRGLSRGCEKELESLIDLPTTNDKLTRVEELVERMGRSMKEAEQILSSDDFFEYEGLYTTLIQVLSSLRKELKNVEALPGEMTGVVIKKQIEDLKREYSRADGKGVIDQYPNEDKLKALDDLMKTVTDLRPVAEKVLGPDHPDIKQLKWIFDVFRSTKKATEAHPAKLKEVTEKPAPVEQTGQATSLASPVEQVEVAREELPNVKEDGEPNAESVVKDDKEKKEEADDFEKETEENGRKMVEVINALLKRDDIPERERVFDAQDPKLAKLQIDIKKMLSTCLKWLSEGTLAVKKNEAGMNNVYRFYILYGVVNADVGDELGKEIEEKLKPLFDERFRLISLAVEENEGVKLEWRHPRTGELIDAQKDICDSTVFVEGVRLGHIVYMTLPGVVQRRRLGGEKIHEEVRSFTHVIASTG